MVVVKTMEVTEDLSELPEETSSQKLLKYLKANNIQIQTFSNATTISKTALSTFLNGHKQRLQPKSVQKILSAYPDLKSIFDTQSTNK